MTLPREQKLAQERTISRMYTYLYALMISMKHHKRDHFSCTEGIFSIATNVFIST